MQKTKNMGKPSQASQKKKTGSAMFMTLQKWNECPVFFFFFTLSLLRGVLKMKKGINFVHDSERLIRRAKTSNFTRSSGDCEKEG